MREKRIFLPRDVREPANTRQDIDGEWLSTTVSKMKMALCLHFSFTLADVYGVVVSFYSKNQYVIAIMCIHYKVNNSSAVAEMGDRGHNRHGPKRGGCCAPFAGAGTPSSTMWPGPRSTSVPSSVFIHPAIWPQYTWAKNWVGSVCPFSGGSWVHIEHNVA